MKRLVLLLLMVPALARAEVSEAERAICADVSAIAGHIMRWRQDGGLMAEAMERARKVVKEGENWSMIEDLIIAAYEEPRWNVEETQTEAVADFQNRWHLACIREFDAN